MRVENQSGQFQLEVEFILRFTRLLDKKENPRISENFDYMMETRNNHKAIQVENLKTALDEWKHVVVKVDSIINTEG